MKFLRYCFVLLLGMGVRGLIYDEIRQPGKESGFAAAWVKTCGKGRVFYTTFGHEEAVYHALGLTETETRPVPEKNPRTSSGITGELNGNAFCELHKW